MKRFFICLTLLLTLATPAFPAVRTLQVTIGSSVTQVSTTSTFCRWVVFQNNAAHNIRVGDVNTTSSRGILLLPTGSFFTPPLTQRGQTTNLSQWYIAGTQNDVVDIVCDDGL